jgi:aquaporin NIP
MMKKYTAEFIGTFALVFCGTGAITIDEVTKGGVSHVGVAITFGLIVMSMIYALGDKSGAHINPAVTIAFAVNGSFKWEETAPYIISQCAGAIAASYLLRFIFPSSIFLGASLPAGSNLQSLILEFVLSFFLMLVIISVAKGSGEQGLFAGIAIGGVVALEAMFAGPICGASMNPARSLGPAVAGDHFQSLWVYIAGPVAGMIASLPFYRFIKNQPESVSISKIVR